MIAYPLSASFSFPFEKGNNLHEFLRSVEELANTEPAKESSQKFTPPYSCFGLDRGRDNEMHASFPVMKHLSWSTSPSPRVLSVKKGSMYCTANSQIKVAVQGRDSVIPVKILLLWLQLPYDHV